MCTSYACYVHVYMRMLYACHFMNLCQILKFSAVCFPSLSLWWIWLYPVFKICFDVEYRFDLVDFLTTIRDVCMFTRYMFVRLTCVFFLLRVFCRYPGASI